MNILLGLVELERDLGSGRPLGPQRDSSLHYSLMA